jgi:predicted secreted Zn-dependent protease
MKTIALIEKLDEYKNGVINASSVLDAVDAYTAARIADSQCSTLRDKVVQRLREVTEAKPSAWRPFKYVEWQAEVRHLQNTLSVIDELQPVA